MGKRILGVDLFRFIAALGILAYHYFFIGVLQGFYSESVFLPQAFWGEFGVDIFFIISGFVIFFSTEKSHCAMEFLVRRCKRILPAFFVCSTFTLLTSMLMPNISVKDLLFRWTNSFTFFCDLWNVGPLSSVYWTLMVEVKFYVLVAVVIKLRLWRILKYKLLFIWEILALIISAENPVINAASLVLILKYAGHFSVGIVLYHYFYKKESEKWTLPVLVAGLWLVFKNGLGYASWIRSLYELPYSDIEIVMYLLLVIAILIVSMKTYDFGSARINKSMSFIGAWSYTLYLIHADFGYFIRVQYFNQVLRVFPALLISEAAIMTVAIISSLLLSGVIQVIIDKVMNKCK